MLFLLLMLMLLLMLPLMQLPTMLRMRLLMKRDRIDKMKTASKRRRLDRDREIAADYLADMSPAAIMEQHGVARQTIYSALARQNVTLRRVK